MPDLPILNSRGLWLAAVAGGFLALTASTGAAQTHEVLKPLSTGFPGQPITLWSAFPAGHPDDLMNNVVAQIATDYAPVRVVTNRNPSGPAVHYALVDFLQSQPRSDEGYHVYAVQWLGVALRPYTMEVLADNTIDDLRPIDALMFRPHVFAVPLDSPFETLEDVAEFAGEKPDALRVVASSTGSAVHVSVLAWANQAGVETRFVPTDGSGQSRQVLLGGGAELGIFSYYDGIGDQFRTLAVSGSERVPTLPDVPSMEELGFGVPNGSLNGYGTLPGVPDGNVEWLAELFAKVAEDPRFQNAYEGANIRARTGEEAREAQLAAINAFYPILDSLGMAIRPQQN